jgi:thiamine transport system permease protein
VLVTAIGGVVIVLVPVLALALASLRGADGWTLSWWASLGSIDAGTTRLAPPAAAITTSLVLATVTALLAALVGGLAALTVLTPGRPRLIAVIAVVPLGVSAATLGLGMLLAFGRPPIDLRASGLLIPIAHSLVAIPLVVAVVAPGVRSTDVRLASVAATLGATPTRAFWTAYGPVLRIVMVASAALAGAVSLGEFGAATFLGRATSPTVPVQIVRLLGRPGEQSLGVAAVLAVILVIVTLAVVLLVDRWSAPARSPMRTPATVAP